VLATKKFRRFSDVTQNFFSHPKARHSMALDSKVPRKIFGGQQQEGGENRAMRRFAE
jgi:hypothetical protein